MIQIGDTHRVNPAHVTRTDIETHGSHTTTIVRTVDGQSFRAAVAAAEEPA